MQEFCEEVENRLRETHLWGFMVDYPQVLPEHILDIFFDTDEEDWRERREIQRRHEEYWADKDPSEYWETSDTFLINRKMSDFDAFFKSFLKQKVLDISLLKILQLVLVLSGQQHLNIRKGTPFTKFIDMRHNTHTLDMIYSEQSHTFQSFPPQSLEEQ